MKQRHKFKPLCFSTYFVSLSDCCCDPQWLPMAYHSFSGTPPILDLLFPHCHIAHTMKIYDHRWNMKPWNAMECHGTWHTAFAESANVAAPRSTWLSPSSPCRCGASMNPAICQGKIATNQAKWGKIWRGMARCPRQEWQTMTNILHQRQYSGTNNVRFNLHCSQTPQYHGRKHLYHGTIIELKLKLKDRITPQINFSSNNQKKWLKQHGKSRKNNGDGGGSIILNNYCMWRVVWQSCVWKIACDKVVFERVVFERVVCERLYMTKIVCDKVVCDEVRVVVWKIVCDKAVCERAELCVTNLFVTKLCVTKLCVTNDKVVCDKVVCDKVACERIVRDKVVCVCDKIVCDKDGKVACGRDVCETLCVTKLWVTKLSCVREMCVKKLCAKELCVTKLRAIKLHVRDLEIYVKDYAWPSCVCDKVVF